MERQAFWWVPPPGNKVLDSPWRPAFIDYLYLSTVVTFSFFPNVEPIKHRSKVLVMIHFLVAFDVDLILLARAVGLLPNLAPQLSRRRCSLCRLQCSLAISGQRGGA